MKQLIYNPNSIFGGLTLFDDMINEAATYDYFPFNSTKNIEESDDTVTLSVDVPGYKKSDISIDYEDHIVTISAKNDSNNRSAITKRFQVGDVSIKESTASLENGVLTVTIQKAASAKKQKINIK